MGHTAPKIFFSSDILVGLGEVQGKNFGEIRIAPKKWDTYSDGPRKWDKGECSRGQRSLPVQVPA